MMAKRIETLRTVSTFKSFTEPQLENAARALETIEYNPGDNVIKQGDDGYDFFIIQEGEVVVSRKTNPNDPLESKKVPWVFDPSAQL